MLDAKTGMTMFQASRWLEYAGIFGITNYAPKRHRGDNAPTSVKAANDSFARLIARGRQ